MMEFQLTSTSNYVNYKLRRSCLICNSNCDDEEVSSCTTIIKSEEDGHTIHKQTSFDHLNHFETFCQLINLSFSTAEQFSNITDGGNGGVSFCTDCAGILQNVTRLLEQIAKLHLEVDQCKVQVESELKQSYINHIDERSCKRRKKAKASAVNEDDGPLPEGNDKIKSSSSKHSCNSSSSPSLSTCTANDRLRELIISELQTLTAVGDPLCTDPLSIINTTETDSNLLDNQEEVETKSLHRKNPRRRKRAGRKRDTPIVLNNTTSLTQNNLQCEPSDYNDFEFESYESDASNQNNDSNSCNDEERQTQRYGLKRCRVSLTRMKIEREILPSSPTTPSKVKPKRRSRPRPKSHQNTQTLEKSIQEKSIPPPAELLNCTECNATFKYKHLLIRHQIDIHTKEYPFFCHNCGRRAYTQKELDFHTARCKKSTLPPNVSVIMTVGPFKLKCNECGFAAVSNTKMGYHLVSHTKDKQFVCDSCGESFKKLTALKSHKLLKHYYDTSEYEQPGGGLKSHPYQCSFEGCGRVFGNRSNLVHHEKKHRGDLDFICSSCDFRTVSAGKLNQHIRYIHEGLRKYKCDQCDATYKGSSGLVRHKFGVHTKEEDKPFKCSYCGKGFREKHPLQRHEISVHTNEKPFECKTCGKRFAIKLYLSIHMRVHQKNTTKKKKSISKNGDEEQMMEVAESSEIRPIPMDLNG